mmetsp:Transcript_15513/g.42073  ORF Transcript_15513/g.42073 Transcript_15513/m.42073 type:complete len:299 (+) Transcript_15513:998-1894(+)
MAEDGQHLGHAAEVEPHALGAALLVRRRHRAELGVPRLPGLVEGRHGAPVEGVLHLLGVEVEHARLVLAQQLPGPVPQQLVDRHLDLEALAAPGAEEGLVVGREEGDLLRGRRGGQHVAQRHVLEAQLLPDVVVVGDVDARGDPGAGEVDHVERREVGAAELVLLEGLVPGQHVDEGPRRVDEHLELLALLAVHHRHEALELRAHAEGVAVRLNEADVGLHGRGAILDPELLRVLVRRDGAAAEVLHVLSQHRELVRPVGGHEALGALDEVGQAGQEGRVVAVGNVDVVRLGLVLEVV